MPNTVKLAEIDHVREKLVELLNEMQDSGIVETPAGFGFTKQYIENDRIASHLIAHGVTVQDGKPLEEFLHPIDAYKGLKAKYLVFKADTGKVVGNCFILRPDKDAAAVEALRAYAKVTDNETLAKDIYNRVAHGVTVQELDGCEYCKEDSEGFRRMFGAFSLVNPFHGKTWQIHAGKCKPREINFCPMCGRRLPQPPKGE